MSKFHETVKKTLKEFSVVWVNLNVSWLKSSAVYSLEITYHISLNPGEVLVSYESWSLITLAYRR
jgi:hypothetical protein